LRILGLDIGHKRIGVAISDPLGITAQGLAVIDCKDMAAALVRLADICREHGVTRIVAGLPLHMSGDRSEAAEKIEKFAAAIEEHTGLPVELVDERLTSRMAEKTLIAGNVRRKARKEVRDMLAAVLILESFLNRAAGPARRQPAAINFKRSVCPMMEESNASRDNLVTLTDEDGNAHDFIVIDAFHVEEKHYVVLLPVYDSEDGGEEAESELDYEEEVYIFRVELDDESGGEILVELDDEAEWERVAALWETRMDTLGELEEEDEAVEENGEGFF
jgi:putative Holliday junction resolvase